MQGSMMIAAKYLERHRAVKKGGPIRLLWQDRTAATALEYAFIAALVSIAAYSVIGGIGTNLTATFTTVAGSF